MNLITFDFETHYADDYTLSKMTTESYIRDPRFEPLIVGVKVNNDPPMHAIGKGAITHLFNSLDIENSALVAHHAHFDGLILSHHFNHRPKVWFDTLSMARALHGAEVGGSLSKLMKHYGVGDKGFEVLLAKNKKLADFNAVEIMQYANYCMNDVQGTYDIFQKMLPQFDKLELRIIDMIVRMFTEPALLLNEQQLLDYALDIQAEKATLLLTAGITKDEVMSNEKFATALQNAGIEPPRKLSPTTGKPAWAFAKTDKAFTDLEEHDLPQVQALVAARLGNKTTINEKRALRMADMAPRGPTPIYLKYSGAEQTHRLSGGDSMNWQNMQRGGKLRDAIYAPEGSEV
jgi:DNA polymerase